MIFSLGRLYRFFNGKTGRKTPALKIPFPGA
jgi:hypothetical protein